MKPGTISKTSRFYIGLAVGLPVFSKISLILTHVILYKLLDHPPTLQSSRYSN